MTAVPISSYTPLDIIVRHRTDTFDQYNNPSEEPPIRQCVINSSNAWGMFTFGIFLIFRISFMSSAYLPYTQDKWYNDIMIFLLSNHYIYKRLHWNNKRELFFRSKFPDNKLWVITMYIAVLIIYTLINTKMDTFFITYSQIQRLTTFETAVFVSLCMYFICNQIYSIYYLYQSHNKTILFNQLYKYLFIIVYAASGQMVKNILVQNPDDTFHIHHWIIGLLLIFITELPQPYHTYIQYIHYAIYTNGIAVYGYDSLAN